MATKSRVVKIDQGYVPQYYQKHFLFGGEWVGLAFNEHGDLYSYTSESAQLDKCVHSTYQEAEETRLAYFARLEAKATLSR